MRRSKIFAIALTITLIIVGLLISACGGRTIDQILISDNDSGDEVVVLVDGRRSSGCIDDEVHRGQANISLGAMLSSGSCNAEVVVFSDDDRVELAAASAWPTSANTLSIPLGDMHVLPVNIWIVHENSSIRQIYLTNAVNQINRSLQLYNDMNGGISYSINYVEIADSSSVTTIQNTVQGVSDSGSCTNIGQITANPAFYTSGEMNVYFVSYSGSRGFACYDDFIAISSIADNETLAHEFGHSLSLDHVDQPSDNLMKTGGTNRTHFTIGQAFRMTLNGGSALNTLNIRSGAERNCPHNSVNSKCPAVLFDVTPR